MSTLTRDEIILKLTKRKDSLSKIVEAKRVSLVAYNDMAKALSKPQQNITACLQAKKDRFDEYEEHFLLLSNDLVTIQTKSDEEIQILWDFYESFVQTSKSVQESLARKAAKEAQTTTKSGVPKSRSKKSVGVV